MNKRMRVWNFIIIFLVSLFFVNCKEKSDSVANNQIEQENFSVREGRRLFIHYCSPCHGESGDGFGKYLAYGMEPKPPDFTLPDFLENRPDELLYLTVSEGSTGLGKSNLCPPWGKTFRKEEINLIVDYVKYLNEIANVNNNSIEGSDK